MIEVAVVPALGAGTAGRSPAGGAWGAGVGTRVGATWGGIVVVARALGGLVVLRLGRVGHRGVLLLDRHRPTNGRSGRVLDAGHIIATEVADGDQQWTFADLAPEQLTLVAEAERTLEPDVVLVFEPTRWGTVDEAMLADEGLHPVDLDATSWSASGTSSARRAGSSSPIAVADEVAAGR